MPQKHQKLRKRSQLSLRHTKAKLQKSIKKLTLKSKLKHQPLSNPEDTLVVDDDLVLGRNRRAKEFGKVIHDEDIELSPYVKIRLALARMKAMEAYKKAQA
jgi:hypothetical protein